MYITQHLFVMSKFDDIDGSAFPRNYESGNKFRYDIDLDMILLDEIEFMEHKTITQVVIPLLGHGERVALGVSTPVDDGNIISDLTGKKNTDSKPLFQMSGIGLACPECVEEEKAAECTHRKKALPH